MGRVIKRIPKNYDGNRPTGRQIRELLPKILGKLSNQYHEKFYQLVWDWPSIVGEQIGKMTRAVSYESGILKVYVSNSTLYSLLVEHEKPRLINIYKKKFPKACFRDIFFKIGIV